MGLFNSFGGVMSISLCTKLNCEKQCGECTDKEIAIGSAFVLIDAMLRALENDDMINGYVTQEEVECTLNELSSAFMELKLERSVPVLDDNYDDSMDGDFDSAMTSAGFGTDENYGGGDEHV
jgi:hypothetical protein